MRRAKIRIFFGSAGIFALVAISGCAGQKEARTAAPERPGLPAYWEAKRPAPGAYYESWPDTGEPGNSGGDGLPARGNALGMPAEGAQRPMRMLQEPP